ncbi:hypothetical protein M3P05_16090 [Sansalvadorimonas sp. 2012CJ34-2]|uniref:Uncharacterized protein n=1 Tax=Parendozoicomonas callyspongiae TaxID=2942213 RepID=A0ABT0PJ73_9GAMM|nr:hypothetical protein [Sansalvadorimonas sp. 2012CJ34-2]MCL6271442.1 hypothetical protein [Sansalvadorimonas sp. 2012CJ34-2]
MSISTLKKAGSGGTAAGKGVPPPLASGIKTAMGGKCLSSPNIIQE